jgi:hypothetical protein
MHVIDPGPTAHTLSIVKQTPSLVGLIKAQLNRHNDALATYNLPETMQKRKLTCVEIVWRSLKYHNVTGWTVIVLLL